MPYGNGHCWLQYATAANTASQSANCAIHPRTDIQSLPRATVAHQGHERNRTVGAAA